MASVRTLDEGACSSKSGVNISISDQGGDGDGPDNNETTEVDNSESVLEKIANLYAEQLMSDINLVVGGVSYPAHRLILCATSEVFQVMLMNREWSEWRESAIELKETPQCASVFPHFLRYFYTGQIRISHKTVLPVLSLADKYNVKDLVSLCICYMSRHMANAAQTGHLVEWLQYTMACGHNHIAKACHNFVKWNFEMIANTSNFANLEPEVLVNLLHQNDLVVHSEKTLYELVMKWLSAQRSRLSGMEGVDLQVAGEHMKELSYALLAQVRLPMMTLKQLAQVVVQHLPTEQDQAGDQPNSFVNLLKAAMKFHAGQPGQPASEEAKLQFMPRLYTEDRWSSQMVIDNFHSLQCYHTRTFVFSSHSSLTECEGDKTCEWLIDLYPKGVWFQKSLLISWQGSFDVPEVVLRTVRLALTCREPPSQCTVSPWDQQACSSPREPCMKVKIGVLVMGVQWGIEHVMVVREQVHHFSNSERVINIDNVLDFDELNTPIYSPTPLNPHNNQTSCSRRFGVSGARKCCHCSKVSVVCGKCEKGSLAGTSCVCSTPEPSLNLVGPNRDQLKLQIVIIPLPDLDH